MNLEQLVASRWEEMAPFKHDYEDIVSWEWRMAKRKEFCQSIAIKGEKIAIQMINKKNWRGIFDSRGSSGALQTMSTSTESQGLLKHLLESAVQLEKRLRKFPHQEKHRPSLVIVFDEVSSLWTDGSDKSTVNRYIALNRVISCLK